MIPALSDRATRVLSWTLDIAVIGTLVALTSCAQPMPVTVHECLPQASYTAAQVTGMIDEMDRVAPLASDMPNTKLMLVGYHTMRGQNAACIAHYAPVKTGSK